MSTQRRPLYFRPPTVDPLKEHYRPNKSEYFTYHAQVGWAFKKDIEKFLLKFEVFQDIRFKTFTKLWRALNFGWVFAGQQYAQQMELFMETSFSTTKKYILFSDKIYIQVGAFYMLYALYNTQECKKPVRIRLTYSEYGELLKLTETVKEIGGLNFLAIFKRLKCLRAFHFVIKPSTYGLEFKFMWQDKKLKNDIFQSDKINPAEEVKKVLYSDDFYGLGYLNEINEEYTQSLKSFGISTSNKTTSICQDVAYIYDKMTGAVQSKSESEEDVKDTIHLRRSKIKNKAYATQVSGHRSSVKSENVDDS